jgi:putative acetyltransferase
MIRGFHPSDMDAVIEIWLDASIRAHDFVAENFWRSRVIDMREVYIPASETYVYEEAGCIRGFVCLVGEALAALFVSPRAQGRGVGQKLIEKSKHVRQNLNLTVYKENQKSVDFYKRCGFRSVKEQIDKYTGHSEIVMVFNA